MISSQFTTHASAGRILPGACPPVRFEAALPAGFSIERMAAGHGLVVVVLRTWKPRATRVVAFDVATGALRFSFDPEGEFYGGQVAFTPAGDLLFATIAYSNVATYRMNLRGQIADVDRFRLRALPPTPFLASEVSVEALHVLDEERHLLSFFEDDEPFGSITTLRSRGAERWMVRGSLSCCAGGLTFGHVWQRYDVIAEQRPLEARRVDDGQLVWSRVPPPHEYENVDLAAGGLLALNDEKHRLARVRHTPVPPALLMLLDPARGELRWTREIDGIVTAATLSPRFVSLVLDRPDETGEILCLDERGDRIRSGPLPRDLSARADAGRGRVVAADEAHLLWASREKAWCEPIAGDGQPLWETALPGPPVWPPIAAAATEEGVFLAYPTKAGGRLIALG